MDAKMKLDVVRGVLAAFSGDDRRSLLYREEDALEEVAVAAIRGVIVVGDAPPPRPKPVTCEEFKAAMRGKKIDAIKALRNRGSVAGVEGLKDAKEAVEEIMAIFEGVAVATREPMPF